MSGEKNKKDKNDQVESVERNLIIPEIIDVADLTGENASWIDDRAEFYISQLQKKYSAAKEQYPLLNELGAKTLEKKFTQWPGEISDTREELFDTWEEAVNAKNKDGDVPKATLKKINALAMKLNDYFSRIEKQGIVGGHEKIDMSVTESFEEEGLKSVEKGIASGRDDINRCRESFELIESSVYKELYDEKFLRQLTDFAKRLGVVEGWLNQLEQAKDTIKARIQKETLSDDQVQEMFDNLSAIKDSVKNNLEALRRGVERVRKDVEKGKEERHKLVGRVEALIDRIEARGQSGFFAGKDMAKVARFMVERLKQMKEKPLDIQSVKLAEKEAEETIFAPEIKSDEKKEKMDILYFWKRRVLDEKKRIDTMIAEFEIAQDTLRKSSKQIQDRLAKVGKALSAASGRNDLLNQALDSINTPKEESLVDIKFQLDAYKDEYLAAEKAYDQLSPELAKATLANLQPKIMSVLSAANKNFITASQKTMIEGWQTVFNKGGEFTLEEVNNFSEKLKDVMDSLGEKQREYMSKVEADLKEKALESEFMAKGEKMDLQKKEFIPLKSAKPEARVSAKTEEEFFGEKVFTPAVERKIGRSEVLTSIKDMFEEQGVIDLEPEKILSALTPAELSSLIENVKEDAKEKADSNRDIFERSLRSILNERLLQALDAEKREKISSDVSAQAYSLLKGAVEAEAQKQLAKLQSGEASKLAKAGKIGAKLAANVGLAAGIGIGAGLVIGSGGAAAAVAGASIAFTRLANKAIAKSEIFQAAKEKVSSLWGKTAGKLFKKEKSPFDTDKILEETTNKFINPEIVAAILSNQLRENSSQELLRAVNAYGSAKSEAMHKPSVGSIEKFESSLDDVSKEFYKKSYNYLAMFYKNDNLPEETLAKMALQMTLNLSIYQRNEVKLLETLEADKVKNKLPEEKHWLVGRMEHFMKFRSEGVGSVLFGGALAYAVSETTSAGRVVSGALAGAGLGLMLERKTRKSEEEKLHKVVEDIINRTEKKLFGKDAVILDSELVKAKKDAAYIRAQIDAGVFERNDMLKNRAENFVVRVNQEMMKTYEAPKFSIDDLLKDVSKHSKLMEKETAKTFKKTSEAFKTKDRALAYMTVGVLVGGAAGYLGARLTQYIRGPKAEEIRLVEAPTEASRPGFVYAPTEKITPTETPLEPVSPPTPLEPTPAPTEGVEEITMPTEHVRVSRGGAGRSIEQAVEKAPPILSRAHEEAVTKAGEPIEVSEVYRASIYEWPKKEPLFFTREEELKINELTEKGEVEALAEFMTKAKSRGQIYEDLKTGKQYHADELIIASETSEPEVEEVVVSEEPLEQARENSENPYNEPDIVKTENEAKEPETEIEEENKIVNPYDLPENKPEAEMERAGAEDSGESDQSAPNDQDAQVEPAEQNLREQAVEEVESAKAREAKADEEDLEADEEIRREAEEYTEAATKRMVQELSEKPRQAYDWLDTNEDNTKLTLDERAAVKDLKNQFVKDMIDDMNIKKSLLDKIEKLKTRVEFEL